jgi:hypothetical protein
MTYSWVGLPGDQAGKKFTESRMVSGLEAGHHGGPAGLAEKCRSSAKAQACRKCAGGAGAAGRILHRVWVLAGIALLAACAGKVEPQIQYVRVEVPVQVLCRAPEVAAPSWAAAGLRKSDSLEVKVRALLAERRQRIGYEKQLEAAVSACR